MSRMIRCEDWLAPARRRAMADVLLLGSPAVLVLAVIGWVLGGWAGGAGPRYGRRGLCGMGWALVRELGGGGGCGCGACQLFVWGGGGGG